LLLLVILAGLFLFLIVATIVAVVASGGARRRFIREIFLNPVVQERIKDSQVNVVDLIDQITRRAEERTAPSGIFGILEKMNQDITWDVSGLIGLIVTVVLMSLILTQKYDNIPREIFAGWTTILGFYFGKAVRK
jgi:hypothetical protein